MPHKYCPTAHTSGCMKEVVVEERMVTHLTQLSYERLSGDTVAFLCFKALKPEIHIKRRLPTLKEIPTTNCSNV
jgi:hypothetical protein